jgi:hypothetical protein
VTVTAKSLASIIGYARRFKDTFATRKNRVMDDRDAVLGAALQSIEARSDDVYPAVTSVSAALTGFSSAALTGLTITGTNFVADTVKASGISDADSATKELTWVRVVPGDEDITVRIASSGVANNTVSCAWNSTTKVLTVTRGTTATAANVVTAVPLDAAGKFIATVTATGDGTGVPTAGDTTLTGGAGSLPVLQVGTIAIDGSAAGNGITGFTDSLITFCVDASALSQGAGSMLRLWVDDVLTLAQLLKADSAGFLSGQTTILNGATTRVISVGAAYNGKPVYATFGAQPTAAGVKWLSGVVSGGNLTLAINVDNTADLAVNYSIDGR